MLTVNFIRQNRDQVLTGLKTRNYKEEASALVDRAIELDDSRKETQTTLDNLLAKNNQISKSIGALYKEGKRDEAEVLKKEVEDSKEEIKGLEGTTLLYPQVIVMKIMKYSRNGKLPSQN